MTGAGYPRPIEDLIDILSSLPSVGRRSAERMALAMLKWQPEKLAAFGDLAASLPDKITPCPVCGSFAENGNECVICSSPLRDKTLVCVVEDSSQIRSVEASALFKGVYHVLGGKLAPLSGTGLDDLNINELMRRVDADGVRELILALSPDVEGQATAVYVGNLVKERGVSVTRLAQGLPAGSDISYADSATIAVALNGRTAL